MNIVDFANQLNFLISENERLTNENQELLKYKAMYDDFVSHTMSHILTKEDVTLSAIQKSLTSGEANKNTSYPQVTTIRPKGVMRNKIENLTLIPHNSVDKRTTND